MKSRRNVVAALALLAVMNAGPAAADWSQPGGNIDPSAGTFDEMFVVAQWGFQMLQVAL